jgi:DNA repair exonuclease SbcCD ATPase subunit
LFGFSQRIEELSRELKSTTERMEIENNEKEAMLASVTSLSEELARQKDAFSELEQQQIAAQRLNDNLDTQLKTAQAKQIGLENEVQTNRKELSTLVDLNQRLQREKQDLLKYVFVCPSCHLLNKNHQFSAKNTTTKWAWNGARSRFESWNKNWKSYASSWPKRKTQKRRPEMKHFRRRIGHKLFKTNSTMRRRRSTV